MSGRLVRPLAAVLLLPLVAAAQESCVDDSVWSLPSSHIVGPRVIRWVGDDLVMFGDRVLVVGKDSAGTLILRDSISVGLSISKGRERMRLVPRPVRTAAFDYARGFQSAGRTTVLWSVPVDRTRERRRLEQNDLRVGEWDGARWRSVRTIGRFPTSTSLSPQSASEIVHASGVHYFAFAVEDSLAPYTHIAVVSDSGGRWRAHTFDLGLRSVSAVALGVDRGRLVAGVLGVPLLVPDDGTMYTATPFVMRLEQTGWSTPVPLGGSPRISHLFPKLLPSNDGLIVAWTSTSESRSALQWRRVSFDGPLGPVHHIAGTGFVMQGQPPFEGLLSALTVDGRAKILRLRSDGFDLIDEFRLTGNFAPAIGGSLDRPIVAYPVLDDPADAGGGHVELRDLRCALRRASRGGTR